MDKERALREIQRRFRHYLSAEIENWNGDDRVRLDALTDVTQAYETIIHDVVLQMRTDERRKKEQ